VRGLARRGAGVEHAHVVAHVERIGDRLRGAVLHRERAVGVAGQTRHVGAVRKHDRVGQGVVRARIDTGLGELREQFLASCDGD
jgi:hypothetical protein